MHNKAFVVDGRVVIIGGRNIADEYFDDDHAYNFRDRSVLLLGGVASVVQQSFDEFWTDERSASVASLVREAAPPTEVKATYDYLHAYACDPSNFWPQVRERITSVPKAFEEIASSGALVWSDSVDFVSDAPGKNAGTEGLGGGGASTAALIALIERGVRVRILTNSLGSTDNLEAFSGYARERATLLALGVELYEFRPDAAVRREVMSGTLQEQLDFTPIFGLHAKSMVVDERIAVIGTFNLDPRSANLNTECFAVIRDDGIQSGR